MSSGFVRCSKSLVIHSPHDLRIKDRPDPAAPGPGEVRLRIRAGGIYGADLHYFHKGGFGVVRLQKPMILGHEVSGEVDAMQRVSVLPGRQAQSV